MAEMLSAMTEGARWELNLLVMYDNAETKRDGNRHGDSDQSGMVQGVRHLCGILPWEGIGAGQRKGVDAVSGKVH
jgi:hypothetical protein